jgi:hypothetical protein
MRIELERDSRLVSMQVEYPNCPPQGNFRARLFNELKQPVEHLRCAQVQFGNRLPL